MRPLERIAGIDPGGSMTGLVLRQGHRLLRHALIKRPENDWCGYVDEVIDVAAEYAAQADLVAVEGLVPPNPHLGLANVRGLLETAQIVGVLFPITDVVVRPARHGATPDIPKGKKLDAAMAERYPEELLGLRERGGLYGGQLRHCRSAWDISRAKEVTYRQLEWI